uniref:Reverse transcriptase domain-containing protein n=1 Tax=Tanacetum cinerariifolium TaxID=118510 RepID=A0A6L2MMG1_TANCI|nr:reverse transcriptase domain-containing protein [Tanacetum cinerariifolium]
MRNTLGKKQVSQDLGKPASDAALRKYCDRNYHQLLPIIAEKVHQEKVQQEKLKVVKAHINFEEASQYSESGMPSRRRSLKERLGSRHVRSMSESPEPRLGDKGKVTSAYSNDSKCWSHHSSRGDTESCYQSSRSRETEFASEKCHNKRASSRRMEPLLGSEDSAGGYWKSKPKRQKSRIKDDLSQPNNASKIRSNPQHQAERGESTKEFVRRYKLECRDVKGALECMKISGIMRGITNPELTKRLHDKIPRSVDEMMRVTTSFLIGEVAASTREQKKSFMSWKQQEAGQKQNFKNGGFRNQQREVGHTTDEYMHLKRQIEEILKARKLSHLIKELKQSNRKNQVKAAKKGETSGNKKPLAILMVQPWQRVAKQRITQTFSPESLISFPPLGEKDGTEDPMIIKAEIGGHFVYRMYVDMGSSSEILYEHCFNRFRLEVKSQIVPTTTSLVGFSREIIWPLGQISQLVKIGDEEHSTSTWMKFMLVRSPSPYNGIIGRPLRSSRIIPLECTMVSGPGVP